MALIEQPTLTGDEQVVSDLVDDLLAGFPPASTDTRTFLGEQFDRGLAWVHFPEGRAGWACRRSCRSWSTSGCSPRERRTRCTATRSATACARRPSSRGGATSRRTRYLRPLFTGEEIWCQLFSEPGSGSDFAGLSSSGVKDGEEWIVNGQKVWTTLAHLSKWGLLVVRTDPQAVKHAGLTAFVVDMQDPTVEIRPLRQMTGEAEFNEVFFSDTRIADGERLGGPATAGGFR